MVSRPGSPTLNNNTRQDVQQSTENEITVDSENVESYNFRSTTTTIRNDGASTSINETPQLRRLKLSRRAHRGCMTRFLSSAQEILEGDTASIENISKLKQQIELKKRDIVTKNLEIEAIIPLEDLETENEENSQALEKIDNIIFDLQKRLQNPQLPRNTSTVQSNTRLPKLTLPTFKGDVLEFPSYWELFQANVHNLTSLTDVQRFSYLKTTLEGEPAKLIANLEMTSRNYNSAIATLKDRYGDKQRIIEAHYQKLLSLESKTESYQHLKDFFDSL